MIPFVPWCPDRGPFSADSTTVCTNVLRSAVGLFPFPDLTVLSDALASECKGAWWYRTSSGAFGFIATTQTAIYRLQSDGSWLNISRLDADQATNGVFSADTDWTKGTNWTISAGEAHATASPNGEALAQAQSLTVGATYKISFTVSDFSAGGVRPRFTGGTTVNGTTVTANGTYTQYLIAVTGNNNFSFEAVGTTTLDIDNVTIQEMAGYTGPDTNDLWQADRFGPGLYITNLNDPLQVFDVETATNCTDVAGSPPQAKFIETVGDFLFLSYLKVGSDEFPSDFQHSKINDPTDWTITGSPGDSDRQQLPDGDEIMGIFSCPGGARVIQRRCKRRLTFTPSSEFAFQVSDIDAARGAIAPNAIVNIGGDSYIYINETGFFLNDSHTAVGSQRVDRTFLADADLDKLEAIQGIADPAQKVVWFRYQDQDGNYKMIGWNWEIDQWLSSDAAAQLLVSAVAIGLVLDDLDDLGFLDDIDIPLDTRLWKGGRITFGAFKEDNMLYLFAGAPMAATVETATTELTPETGSYVWGAKLKGDVPNYTISVGSAELMDDQIVWGPQQVRDTRTGMCNMHNDAHYHRFRVVVPAETEWNHLHGLTPFFNPTGDG